MRREGPVVGASAGRGEGEARKGKMGICGQEILSEDRRAFIMFWSWDGKLAW